ncbi:MAG: hypothetical protein HY812_16575 [Planctomycetes bacterium]|nr:hypothetical protein [Planctomycetota bacterium]
MLSRLPCGFLLAALAAPAAGADSLDAGVPIDVFDELGLARSGELVRLAVPLAESSAVLCAADLALHRQDGVEVPVQWRVLTRWKGAPADQTRPIRFALAQFQVDLGAGQAKSYVLRRRHPGDPPASAPAVPLKLLAGANWMSVLTGPARFDFLLSSFNLFQSVWLDLDGNGKMEEAAGEWVVRHGHSLGSCLVDPFDGAYLGCLDAQPTYTIEEAGPLLVVLRVDGRHLPAGGPALQRDYLLFSARFYFVAGSPAVRVEYTLKNTYLSDPLGGITLARYLLHTRLAANGLAQVAFGPDEGQAQPAAAALQPGQEAFLVQDSSGGTHWNHSNNPGTTFCGWRRYVGPHAWLCPESLPAYAPAACGARAEGWMDVRDAQKGVLVALSYPWQNFPYALRGCFEGSIVVDLWPAEFAGLHWLDDAQQKTHELVYSFHAASGFDARLEARRQTHPLLPHVPLWYLRETKAWGDLGDLRDPGLTFSQMKAQGEAELAEDYSGMDLNGGFGWSEFGEPVWAKSTHTTGSPRNRLTYFDRFMISGARAWFEKEEVFALHSMDLRTYHIDGFRKEDHPNTYLMEGLPHYNSYDQLGRDQISAALDPYKAGIPDKGHKWNGYDADHMVLDDLYEYYLLTGSRNALDAVRSIAEGINTWDSPSPWKAAHSSRSTGWTLRALMKAYAATGDARFLARAQGVVQSVQNFRGQSPSPLTGLLYHYLTRQVYGAAGHNMTLEYDLPWQIAVGMYGLALYGRETGDPAVDPILADLSNYIIDYAVAGGVVLEALACDDHLDVNPKESNSGVNSWISSALAIAWRVTKRAETLALAQKIFAENKTGFGDADDSYHWFHSVGAVLGK